MCIIKITPTVRVRRLGSARVICLFGVEDAHGYLTPLLSCALFHVGENILLSDSICLIMWKPFRYYQWINPCARNNDSLEPLAHGLSWNEYEQWQKSAREAKDKYVLGEITAEEALEIIEVKD